MFLQGTAMWVVLLLAQVAELTEHIKDLIQEMDRVSIELEKESGKPKK